MEILVKLASCSSSDARRKKDHAILLHSILSQLFTWSSASHHPKVVEMSLLAVTRIRNLAMIVMLEAGSCDDRDVEEEGNENDSSKDNSSQGVFRRCMNHVLDLLDRPSPVVMGSALIAMRDALRDFDEFAVDVGKDATDVDNANEPVVGESSSFTKNTHYIHQLMAKIPRCIVVLEDAKMPLRERSISAILFLVEKYPWALPGGTSPAYILEDLFDGHFSVGSNGKKTAIKSTSLKMEFLSAALISFVDQPNETLPILKQAVTQFNDDQDVFLQLKAHRLFFLLSSF